LKGARTLVAAAEGRVAFNTTGNPGMATGGMGDTLTGLLVALLGQGYPAYDAARLGAWLCGRAAESAIEVGGASMESVTASMVREQLGQAFGAWRAGCY